MEYISCYLSLLQDSSQSFIMIALRFFHKYLWHFFKDINSSFQNTYPNYGSTYHFY